MTLITLFYRINFKLFKRQSETPWVVLYQKTLKTLASKGLTKPLNMTVLDFSTLVSTRFPQISNSFLAFSTTFNQLNYRELSESQRDFQLRQLKKQYKRITENLS